MAACVAPPSAQARVEFRSASCYGETSVNDTDTLRVPRPSPLSSGDLLIASITALDHDDDIAPPAGWTMVIDDDPGNDGTATFRKFATGSEPETYDFFGNDSDIQIASITAFSGVDADAPIAPSPGRGTGSGTTWTLPNANALRWGSMRYTAVASDANVSSTFSAGLTEACDFGISTRAVASAWERTNAGTTATRSVTRTGTAATLAHTLVLQPTNFCGSGGLNLMAPDAVTFPTTGLTGFDQTLTAAPSFTVDDQRNVGSGWNLSATSTTFTNGSATLPTGATRLMAAAPTPGAGVCEAPVNDVTYPITLPADTTAPAAAKVFNAAAESGLGPVDIVFDTRLAVPANARAGTYTSTWTFTIATGP